MTLQLFHRPTRRFWLWLAAFAVFAGSAAYALPVVDRLGGGSQQFQAAASGYERANAMCRRATGQSAYFGVDLLLEREAAHAGLAASAQANLAARLRREHGFERAVAWSPRSSSERTILMAAFATPADSQAAVAHLRAVVRYRRTRPHAGLGGWRVIFGGPDIAFGELQRRTSSDVAHIESYTIPLLLVLCFFVFGGAAMMLPVLVGGGATVVALTVLGLLDQVGVAISVYCLPAVFGLGLGLGIDYSLLLLNRYRQELGVVGESSLATQRTLATAGRTVLASSFTVAAALACLLVFPLEFLRSIGIAAGITALAAGATARAIAPAMLSILGSRRGSIRWRRSPRRRTGVWERVARRVTAHPVPVVIIAASGLLAAGTPALGLQLVPPSAQLLPAGAESRRVEGALASDFAADPAGVIYTLYRPNHHSPSAQAIAHTEAQIARGRAQVLPSRYLGKGTWELSLLPHGFPDSPANQQLLGRLQAATASAGALIGGFTAFFVDQQAAIAGHLALALIPLAAVTAIMLWVASGSVVIAVKGIFMSLISVAAGTGILVAVVGSLEEADLVFLIALALALSIDYEIFLIARIREERARGRSNREAITTGLATTGSPISSAALLFCVSVGAFAHSSLFFARQFGVGAAVTVAIDALAVRTLLVPSLMMLLGECNWWSPAPLRHLYDQITIPQRLWHSEPGDHDRLRAECRMSDGDRKRAGRVLRCGRCKVQRQASQPRPGWWWRS